MHLAKELLANKDRISVRTRFGPVTGGRAINGVVVFLELPYALPPRRFENPEPLPSDNRYENKEYIYESSYAVQPANDGQATGISVQDKLGLGEPTENPFLQFGSPHGLISQAQYVAAARSEIYVNIGYRLSAFGFLACDNPRVEGNFGFKDQWLALQWINDNIATFGGDPDNIQLTGLSAGAHSVHQILHHVSRLPEGQNAPFKSAMLQSNAIVLAPKTPADLRPQFAALCSALSIDPSSPDALATLKDPRKTSWQAITSAINDEKLGSLGTFRGCMDGDWLANDPEPMTWQRSEGFAEGLRRAGLRSVVVGDLKEEWYLYAIAHRIEKLEDVRNNLLRYYPERLAEALLARYPLLPADASQKECFTLFGKTLSDGQVHLPVRLLARDLISNGFPVLRYEIRWTPEQIRERVHGYVTHGTDRFIWYYYEPLLTADQKSVVLNWLVTVDEELAKAEKAGELTKNIKEVLTLREDRSIGWEEDTRYDDLLRLVQALV